MTVDRLAVCEPLPEPQELGLEHLQLCTARDDTSRCGTDYIRFCAETRDEMRVGDYEHRLCGASVSSPSSNSSSWRRLLMAAAHAHLRGRYYGSLFL